MRADHQNHVDFGRHIANGRLKLVRVVERNGKMASDFYSLLKTNERRYFKQHAENTSYFVMSGNGYQLEPGDWKIEYWKDITRPWKKPFADVYQVRSIVVEPPGLMPHGMGKGPDQFEEYLHLLGMYHIEVIPQGAKTVINLRNPKMASNEPPVYEEVSFEVVGE